MATQRKARIIVQQIKSPIGRPKDQRATLIGLGLNKCGRFSTLEDTSAIRGMINKVSHLVKIVEDGNKKQEKTK